jgi:cation diffusion facilitator CzcD-associated flavoprotein CzcO
LKNIANTNDQVLSEKTTIQDVIIIGGGQSALACGYFLRRLDADWVMLDAQEEAGGAWQHTWDSLTTFSPAQYSSLPGWLMPKSKGPYPTRDEVLAYLRQYEVRYELPVCRPVEVRSIKRENNLFYLDTTAGRYICKALISATGTWQAPYIPNVPGRKLFAGRQLHSAFYESPLPFRDKRVLVIGEGNSGAQILADLLPHVSVAHWATKEEPDFLPEDVDGRVLFNVASAKYYAEQKGETFDTSKLNLGNIVLVPSIRQAFRDGHLISHGQIREITEDGVVWQDDRREQYDALIWCTGFHYATDHLEGLVPRDHRGRIQTKGTKATEIDNLWLVGYGNWTGFASATMIGVGRSARKTIREVERSLGR